MKKWLSLYLSFQSMKNINVQFVLFLGKDVTSTSYDDIQSMAYSWDAYLPIKLGEIAHLELTDPRLFAYFMAAAEVLKTLHDCLS